MKKNSLSEEEIKKIKEELKEELKAEMLKEAKEEALKEAKAEALKEIKEEKTTKRNKKVVSNATYKPEEVKSGEFKIPSRKKSFFEPNVIEKKTEEEKNKEENINESKTSPVLIFSILVLLVFGVIFVPKIYNKYGRRVKQDKIEDPEVVEPAKDRIEYTWDDEAIKSIYFPVMRQNKYQSSSYYQRDELSLTDLSNNELLYNTLKGIYSGHIADYFGGYVQTACTNGLNKSIKSSYVEAHINQKLTKTNYVHADFVVPSNIDSQYAGLWKYDAANGIYVYYGDCNPDPTSDTVYYDIKIEDKINTLEDGNKVDMIYYIAFVKVSNNNYIVYSDANYTDELKRGVLTTNDAEDELYTILKADKENLATYKYTFSKENCTYKSLCFISGEYNG